jgi:hypothetical protein
MAIHLATEQSGEPGNHPITYDGFPWSVPKQTVGLQLLHH